jgi:hypothetical protein
LKMGKSKKDLRSRLRQRRRLTRKKIMLRGGEWIIGPNGKPTWVEDEYGNSYDRKNYGSYGNIPNIYPTRKDERTRDRINKTLAQLDAEENQNRPPFYPYASLKEKQAAEAKEKEAAFSRIQRMKEEALELDRSRNLQPSYPRNVSPSTSYQERGSQSPSYQDRGSPPPSYHDRGSPPPSYNSIDEERRQAQIKLILGKTSQNKKKEREAMLQKMTLEQIHAWIINKNKQNTKERFYDAEEGPDVDVFYDANEYGGGVKRRGKKRRTLKRRSVRKDEKVRDYLK